MAGRRRKLRWTDYCLVDENNERIGDDPEYYPGWLVCPKCKCPMPYYGLGTSDDYFQCDVCGKKIFADDLTDDDYPDEDTIPYCCQNCGGPYPDCTSSCKIFDD